MQHLLAIDQGTTGTTVLLIEVSEDKVPRIVARGYSEFTQHFPREGWVEHDLEDIWASVNLAVRSALTLSDVRPDEIKAIGITNQRETTGIWEHGGDAMARAIVWQDRRTAEQCRFLKDAGHEAVFRERTGLLLDPYFSGTKIAWLLDHTTGARGRAQRGELRFGTMDTWLLYRLTGRRAHLTDVTNASRTLLFDIHKRQWDEKLCRLAGEIPMSMLPRVCSSSGSFGETHGLDFLPDGIPITGIAGDQQASLFGQGCLSVGMAKCTYGTGAFALVNTGRDAVAPNPGLLTTVAWDIFGDTTYALEGSTFVAGAAVQWLRDGLGIIKRSGDVEKLARSVPDNGGVTFVPALTGLGAPHWRPEARGVIRGVSRGTTAGHLARAALEGIALQVADLFNAFGEQHPLSELRVDGGACANDLLMQAQADYLGVTVLRPTIVDTTA